MHKHRQSIRGKVKKVFVAQEGETRYYNIKLNKHVVASYVTERHVEMLVEGYNMMVDKKRKRSQERQTKFGYSIVKS